MNELILTWWPVIVTTVSTAAAGIAGYSQLKAEVKADRDLQTERYETILRDVKRLDEKVETLTDFLLRTHGPQ